MQYLKQSNSLKNISLAVIMKSLATILSVVILASTFNHIHARYILVKLYGMSLSGNNLFSWKVKYLHFSFDTYVLWKFFSYRLEDISGWEKVESRILNGQTVPAQGAGAKPYLVFIWDDNIFNQQTRQYGQQVCTGVIVSKNTILTAAHCLDNLVGTSETNYRWSDEIANRWIYFGVRDTRNKHRADVVGGASRQFMRRPKIIKGLYTYRKKYIVQSYENRPDKRTDSCMNI